jgi:hypothetical protein
MMINDFVMEHAFLTSSAVYLAVAAALGRLTLPAEQFRVMHLAGLATATCGVFSYFLEYNYWTPSRLGGVRIGIEDFLISYAVGVIPWYLVAILWKKRLRVRLQWTRAIRNFLMAAASCYVTYLIAVWTGMNPMTALIAVCVLMAFALLYLRPGNWPLALTGMITFPAVWFVVVAVTFRLFPDFLTAWNLASQWGRPLYGVPIGEIVWSVVFGAVLPLLTGIVFNVEIIRNNEKT